MDDKPEPFEQFGLSEPLMKAIHELGYERPTPIQIRTIPLLMEGRDVIGQAQTGTGKTAAFALPILENLDLDRTVVQALILTPTRELGIQVAEAFHTYGRHLNVRVLPVYGGQSIQNQINRLKRGVHVVVGTPGRIMDHLRRGVLDFRHLKTVVLDEADEMLRMGFIEDVEWILAQAPEGLLKALFSATMPEEIRRIADRYLKDPVTVEIKHKTLTVPNTQQRYIMVSQTQKVSAMAQILETEVPPGEGVLVFAGTKVGAAELAEKLKARGFAAEAMHGDMNQSQRENVVRRLRSGQLDIVVATDVAARGWDVERIGLVVNYDIPYDTESYVHRIGRTGRAGRKGKSLVLVTPRQKRTLRDIERYTGQTIDSVDLPTQADIATRRIALFKEQILKTLEEEDLDLYLTLVEDLAETSGRDMSEIAAASARLARGDKPLEVTIEPVPEQASYHADGMVRLFIDAGRKSGVRPADIVGAIANEADVPGDVIGAIDIYDRFSFVEIPKQYLGQVLERMDGTTIRSRDARIRVARPKEDDASPRGDKPTERTGGKGKGKRGFPKSRRKFTKRPRKD
jgi:ATP-dependent RNA helicase DeaD